MDIAAPFIETGTCSEYRRDDDNSGRQPSKDDVG